jgi:two-component system response regulator GlrR
LHGFLLEPPPMQHRLLVIEDETEGPDGGVHGALAAHDSFVCDRVRWADLAPESLGRHAADAVVAVADPEAARVASVCAWLAENPIATPTLAVVPVEAGDPFLHLVSQSADDVIFSPVRPVELRHRLIKVLEPRSELEVVRRRLLEEMGLTRLVGKDPAFLRAIESVPRFARADVPVLITGETGTGKELCARAVHHLSRRRNFPFVTVDCGAVPETLFENELFGHVRGAFTGADRDHKGLVSLAEGGTLFLDEIDALSLGAQAKLLRFLQEHTFRALGSGRTQRGDVKIIGATNRDLELCMKNRQFRPDLYFRLHVLRIHLPPLRERRGDVELLAYNFLRECSGAIESPPTSFSQPALRLLRAHDWPGNIRELGNVVQRAAVACDGATILPAHLQLASAGPAAPGAPAGDFRAARAAAIAAFERRYLEDLLRKHGGNVTHAAREAQQDRRAFGRYIKKYQIRRQEL